VCVDRIAKELDMKSIKNWRKWVCFLTTVVSIATGGALCAIETAEAVPTDDQVLFNPSGYASPNVMFLLDTSGSMRTVVVHESYTVGDGASSDCRVFGGGTYNYSSDQELTVTCPDGSPRKRWVYVDPALKSIGWNTWYEGDYLNWLFSSTTPASVHADRAVVNGETYKCLTDSFGNPLHYSKYIRSRSTAAEKAVEDVICLASKGGGDPVRFGVARFRRTAVGGFVIVPNAGYSDVYRLDGNDSTFPTMKSQEVQLRDRLSRDVVPDGNTPLAESLFQIYTYFMSRDQTKCPWVEGTSGYWETYSCYECRGSGRKKRVCQVWPDCQRWVTTTGKKYFPTYEYRTSDGNYETTDVWKVPDSPVSGTCQNNYVIVLSDGEPTSDTFGDSGNTARGFSDVNDLIGGKTLDLVARNMYENDMFPDDSNPGMPGKQNVIVYTVGFNAPLAAQDLLKRTADYGGGRNFNTSDTDALTNELTAIVLEMVAGAQSFAASSVPSSRQSLGAYFYTSFFEYTLGDPFWEGHLMSLNMSIGGGIFDKNWKCALKNPDNVDSCKNGELMLDELQAADSTSPYYREPVFDVAAKLTDPGPRTLYVSDSAPFETTANKLKTFTTADVDAADLEINTPGEAANYVSAFMRDLNLSVADVTTAGLDALSNEDLADVIVEYGRGCTFGSKEYTGACVTRTNADGKPKLLADIFHSAPLLVGSPNAFGLGTAYREFQDTVKWRPLMIYVGANDGFLHAFKAGDWVCTPGPCSPSELPDQFVPSGEEMFGFMPWPSRKTFKEFPIDGGAERNYYFVDGSPVYADVWINRNVNSATQLPSGSRITGATTKLKEQWRTVVIGGLRQGGASYYALDVTDPNAATFPTYLWEFPCEIAVTGGGKCSNTSAALYVDTGSSIDPVVNSEGFGLDAYVGQTWSDPVIYRVKVNVAGVDVERWVTIVGGGYDPSGDPNHPSYDSSNAAATNRKGRAIFMIDVSTGEILASKRFDHTGGSLGRVGENGMRYAIPSSVVVDDANSDGFADFIYVGDLGGNIWRWDVSKPGADVGVDEGQSDWPFELFFQAGGNRSFYFPPVIATTANSSARWLVAATGNRANILATDVVGDDSDNNRIYAIRDLLNYPSASLPLTESDLLDQTILDPTISQASYEAMLSSTDGYYIVAEDAEKFVSRIAVLQGKVTVGSFLPKTSVGCVQTGEAYYYEFDLASSYGSGHLDATDPAQRKRNIGVGLPRDPRPSYGAGGQTTNICLPNDPSCSCVDKGPCCQVPEGGWSPCDETCGRCSMSIGGASSGGTSAECSSCTSPWLPKVRTWREE